MNKPKWTSKLERAEVRETLVIHNSVIDIDTEWTQDDIRLLCKELETALDMASQLLDD
jgi:hypothetical protein